MSNIAELRDERGKLAHEMNALVDSAAKDKRELSAEDEEKFTRLDTEQSKLRSLIEKLEKADTINTELSQVRTIGAGREDKVVTSLIKPEASQLNAWRSYLKHGMGNLSASEVTELRSLTVSGDGTTGGYAAPAQPTSEFIKKLNDLSSIRSAPVRFVQTNSGNDIPFPTFDDTSNTGDETAEEGTIDVNVDPTFGQITLKAFKFDSSIVKISVELLQDSVIPVESVLNDALGERVAKKINLRYTAGNGTTQPQGIVTGAGNSSVSLPATTLGADAGVIYQNLQRAIHSVGPQYRRSPAFGLMFNDATLLELKKLVDDQKRPLWVASMSSTEPDRVCGVPYYINPDMANIGASAKSIVVGDFSQFYVRDVMQVAYVRLNELFAATQQVGFMCWFRTDSRVMNNSAIKYVAHAAS